MFRLQIGSLAARLGRPGSADRKPVPPKPAASFDLTYCVVCGRPIAPGSQALELRFGRFIDGLAADQEGNRAAPAFAHAGLAVGSANCLTEESLRKAVSATGAQLRVAALRNEPEGQRPPGRLIFLPGAVKPADEDPEPDPPASPWQRRRSDRPEE